MSLIFTVTGCAGFIGSALTKRLLELGHSVYGIDKYTYAANIDLMDYLLIKYPYTFKLCKEDIATLTWLPDCDYIINLAAESDVDNSSKNCSTFVTSNIQGVQNLLNIITNGIINKTDKPTFIQMSTDEVYGDIIVGSFNEDAVLKPSNPYSATKASADLLIQSWARTFGLEYNIVRPSNNYGFNQYPEKLIPISVKRLKRDKKIKLHNMGEPIRTWTHVEDTVDALLIIMNLGAPNTIYNVSSEVEYKNKVVVEYILREFYNKKLSIEPYVDFSHSRAGQDIRYSVSCEPLKGLGWKPKRIFDKEIAKIVKHYKNKSVVW